MTGHFQISVKAKKKKESKIEWACGVQEEIVWTSNINGRTFILTKIN